MNTTDLEDIYFVVIIYFSQRTVSVTSVTLYVDINSPVFIFLNFESFFMWVDILGF